MRMTLGILRSEISSAPAPMVDEQFSREIRPITISPIPQFVPEAEILHDCWPAIAFKVRAENSFSQKVYVTISIAVLLDRNTTTNRGRHLAQYLEDASSMAVTESRKKSDVTRSKSNCFGLRASSVGGFTKRGRFDYAPAMGQRVEKRATVGLARARGGRGSRRYRDRSWYGSAGRSPA